MKKIMKKLKTYDIENIVRNTLLTLMFLNIIMITCILSHLIYLDSETIFLSDTIVCGYFDVMLWPLSIITYIFSIVYLVAAIKTKNDKFFKITFAILSFFVNAMSSALLAMGLGLLFG